MAKKTKTKKVPDNEKLLPKGLLFSDRDETNTETGFATDKADETAKAIYNYMVDNGSPGDVFYDAKGMSEEYGFDRDACHKDTPQSIADMFNTYAEIITKAINKPDCKPDDPANFYYTRVQLLNSCRRQTKKYLGIALPDLPTLTGTDYNRGMIDLVEWIESAKETVNGKAEDTKTKERIILKDFIKKHCDLSEKPDIDSKCEMLMREHRKDRIKLPLVKHKYRQGQRKLYYLEKLIKNWPDYRMTLTTLPSLKKSDNK